MRAGKQLDPDAPCGLAGGETVHVLPRARGGDALIGYPHLRDHFVDLTAAQEHITDATEGGKREGPSGNAAVLDRQMVVEEARRALQELGCHTTLRMLRMQMEATLQQPLSAWKATLREVATQYAIAGRRAAPAEQGACDGSPAGARAEHEVLEEERAAAQADEPSSAKAQCRLAFATYRGAGGAVEHAEARRLFGLAAARGNAVARCNLAVMTERGDGGPADLAEARRLYALAAAQGFTKAQCWSTY